LSPAAATHQSLQDAVTGFAQQWSLNPKAFIAFKAAICSSKRQLAAGHGLPLEFIQR